MGRDSAMVPDAAAQADSVMLLEAERQQRRPTSVLRAVRLLAGGIETLCLMRSIAPRGFSAESGLSLHEGERIAVMLGERRAGCSVVRSDQSRFDADFDEPILVADWLDEAEGGARRSAPRVGVEARARLMLGRQSLFVTLRDISSQGAQIETDEILFPGDAITLCIRGWPAPIGGVVRWSEGVRAGIAFDRPLRLAELMAWLDSGCGTAQPDAETIRRMVRQ